MILLDILNQVVDIDTDIFLSINRMHIVVNGFGFLCMLLSGMSCCAISTGK